MYKQDYTASDIAFNADMNPRYKETLETLVPGIMLQIEEHIRKSDAIHVEFNHPENQTYDQVEIKKTNYGYELNILNTKTGESLGFEVSDNPKEIAEKFTSKLASIGGFNFDKTDISVEALSEQASKVLNANNKIKQMFALEPDSQSSTDNLSAKMAVSELQDIKWSGPENKIKENAKIIIEKLNEIRNSNTESGRAEIRNAAMVVATLCHNDRALADEIASAWSQESRA